jgi:hypothetical protein
MEWDNINMDVNEIWYLECTPVFHDRIQEFGVVKGSVKCGEFRNWFIGCAVWVTNGVCFLEHMPDE